MLTQGESLVYYDEYALEQLHWFSMAAHTHSSLKCRWEEE